MRERDDESAVKGPHAVHPADVHLELALVDSELDRRAPAEPAREEQDEQREHRERDDR